MKLSEAVIEWIKSLGLKKAVVGISGGKDSTVVAGLCVAALGKENVLGVMMPNGVQKDISDSQKVIEHLGIKGICININTAFEGIINAVNGALTEVSYDTKTNLPARLRMSTLYAVAQTWGGWVANTCNISEDYAPGGYATLFGDNAGSFAPLQDLTVTEVRMIGDELGLPFELTHKTPIDGLQPLSDEEKIAKQTGIENWTYERFDKLLRCENHDFTEKEVEILKQGALAGKFKRDMVKINHFVSNRPNFFEM